jgi:hypothetical protein
MMIFIFIASVSRWPPYVAVTGAAEHQIGPRGLDDEAGGNGSFSIHSSAILESPLSASG